MKIRNDGSKVVAINELCTGDTFKFPDSVSGLKLYMKGVRNNVVNCNATDNVVINLESGNVTTVPAITKVIPVLAEVALL